MIGKITVSVKKPKGVSTADFTEWIKFHSGKVNELTPENAMNGIEIEDLVDPKKVRYLIIR